MKTYLNNAGASIVSDATFNAVVSHMQLERGVGAYVAAQKRKNELAAFYSSVATLINATEPSEIAFVDSASRGWNLAIYGLRLSSNDTVITLSTEYGTNLLTLVDYTKKIGAKLEIIQCNRDGSFQLSDLESKLMKGASVIAISHSVAQGSIINPVYEIGQLAKKYNAVYIVDGCQSVGQMPIDVQAMQCDAFMVSGRKWLRAPRGTGFLYVRTGAPINATQIDLASADLTFGDNGEITGVRIVNGSKHFELWERNIASVLGFAVAIDELLAGNQNDIYNSIYKKASSLRQAVLDNHKLHLVGSSVAKTGIVGFYAVDRNCEEHIKRVFSDNDIVISTISDWDCPLVFPKDASCIFRLSPHYYTEDKDISYVAKLIATL
ncbi:MAG: aminotransferase class V-fold PLP-dependent enzyme [Oscillospiraceae bacterium]|jgi:selenocysteine lyase/cysteine desulfurase|nr:aminotransferase class V-fold PLP-dependent enzyme [Oscillospiraceae bacterium]